MSGRALAVGALLLAVKAAFGSAITMECAPDSQPTQPCRAVHGRLSVSNGIPVRIWIVGTKHVLNVRNELNEAVWRYLSFETSLYGDFLVCPLSPEVPGHMQPVCVQSAERLVAERYNPDTEKYEVFRVLSTWRAGEAGGTQTAPSVAPTESRGALPNIAVNATVLASRRLQGKRRATRPARYRGR